MATQHNTELLSTKKFHPMWTIISFQFMQRKRKPQTSYKEKTTTLTT